MKFKKENERKNKMENEMEKLILYWALCAASEKYFKSIEVGISKEEIELQIRLFVYDGIHDVRICEEIKEVIHMLEQAVEYPECLRK